MAYALPGRSLPRDLPEHDLAFVAIAATDDNRRVLAELEERLAWWPAPVINLPARVSMLEPDELAANLEGVEGLLIPRLRCVRRDTLLEMSDTSKERSPQGRLPIVVKPADAPGIVVAEKVDTSDELARYLSRRSDNLFLVAPFVDCRSDDGLFRKFRIVFIDRRAYACHMAISGSWNASYVDARMDADARGRQEEENFFATFDESFAMRHEATFAALVERVDLAYFGIDCAETASGELVVFKADHTLLVHDMDPVDVFPYKPAQMRKIFDAFAAYLYRAAEQEPRGR
jgi:hypothetical protein